MGVSAVCPPATYLSFLLEFSPIFTTQVMWQFIFCYPIGVSDSSPSNTSSASLTASGSFFQAYIQRVFPFYLSISMASLNPCLPFIGIRRPQFIICSQYLVFILATICSLLFRVWGIHRVKSGCESTLFYTSNLESYNGYGYLTSFNLIQNVPPYLYWKHTSQPRAVCVCVLFTIGETTNASFSLTSCPLNLKDINESSNLCRLPCLYLGKYIIRY